MMNFLNNETDVRRYVGKLKNFYGELSSYVLMITVCLILWLLGGAGYFWPFWVMLVWGLSLFLKASRLYLISPRYYETAHSLRENLPFVKSHWEEEKIKELLINYRIPKKSSLMPTSLKSKK